MSPAGRSRWPAAELEDAGEIPVIRRRGRGTPVNYGYRSAT